MPRLKSLIGRTVTQVLTSDTLQSLTRAWHRSVRQLTGRQPEVHYFHQVDDPYSQLALMALPELAKRYAVRWTVHLVPTPDRSAAPDPERLQRWSAQDAQRLAQAWPLDAPHFASPPSERRIQAAQSQLAIVLHGFYDMDEVLAVSDALWRGLPLDETIADQARPRAWREQALAKGQALRKKLGHYLGATFYFEGEWYWGLDRLHYLEQRLIDAGLCNTPAPQTPGWPVPELRWQSVPMPAPSASATPLTTADSPASATTQRPVLHFYCSFRSPYTYLAMARVRRLAAHYQAELRLHFVLPMVMRGLPVPLAKRLYIVRDAQREARRAGLRFGKVVDPVGTPTERGLALLHHADMVGQGAALAESFLQGVFADGLDAGTEAGLRQIALRAGLSAQDVDVALMRQAWREVAESNRSDMLARGLWGVPSFRINERPALWGQDRLWMLEQDLIDALAHAGPHTKETP
jgi:2-hydroxychromene-2-carboxylate isomerase